MPSWSKKRGPIDYLFTLWRSEARHAIATIALNPSDVVNKE